MKKSVGKNHSVKHPSCYDRQKDVNVGDNTVAFVRKSEMHRVSSDGNDNEPKPEEGGRDGKKEVYEKDDG